MIRAWVLPLVVVAIAVPLAAGFLVGGPALGTALGALAVAVMLFVVARMRPHTRIEVAAAADHRFRLLVVALVAIEDPAAAAAVAQSAAAGGEVLVLAPAFNTGLAHWTDDLEGAREAAQQRLVLSLGSLATAGIDARGRVGDADPVQAVEDLLREFAADEAIVVAEPVEGKGAGARTLGELRSRLDLPLRLVET
jgi:hypothetical protein